MNNPAAPVALVAPCTRAMVLPQVMGAIQSGVGFLPPLGLLYLASHLGAQGLGASVLDANLLGIDADGVARWVRSVGASILGVTALTLNMPSVLSLARAVKERSPECVVVLGGPHATLFPEETLEFPSIDYLVRGEGEVPFCALAARLVSGRTDIADLPGVMDRSSGLKAPFVNEDLDALCFPAREAVPYRRYRTVVSKRPPVTTLFSTRGCPYPCIFCNTAGGKKVRSRTAAKVLEEILSCRKMGIREVFFFDENLGHDRDRLVELCRGLIDAGVPVTWEARTRVDCVDEDLLSLMARAGCRRMQYGVESGVQRIIDALGKRITLGQAMDAFYWTRKAGIATYADFMLGCPGEGPDDVEETLRFALSLGADFAHFSILIPYPETKLYDMAREKGILEGDPWRAYALAPSDDFEVPYYTEIFTRSDLEDLLKRAYRSFYLRPSYVARSFAALASPWELGRKAYAAFRLFLPGRAGRRARRISSAERR